jgi:hypothetical protein
MASNCRGVFTPVGDVEDLVRDVSGYKVAGWDSNEFLNAVLDVLQEDKVEGRKALISKGLDIGSVAKKLREVYDAVV